MSQIFSISYSVTQSNDTEQDFPLHFDFSEPTLYTNSFFFEALELMFPTLVYFRGSDVPLHQFYTGVTPWSLVTSDLQCYEKGKARPGVLSWCVARHYADMAPTA